MGGCGGAPTLTNDDHKSKPEAIIYESVAGTLLFVAVTKYLEGDVELMRKVGECGNAH